jgi:aspartyl protease family protein
MQKLFGIVVVVGLAIGFAVPDGRQAPRAAARESSEPAGETHVERSTDGHFYVHANVDGELVRFMVDTGASSVALTVEDAERVGIEVDPDAFEVVGTSASGPARGQFATLDSVDVDGKEATGVKAAVVDGLDVSLLGQAYLSQLHSVTMTGDQMVLR